MDLVDNLSHCYCTALTITEQFQLSLWLHFLLELRLLWVLWPWPRCRAGAAVAAGTQHRRNVKEWEPSSQTAPLTAPMIASFVEASLPLAEALIALIDHSRMSDGWLDEDGTNPAKILLPINSLCLYSSFMFRNYVRYICMDSDSLQITSQQMKHMIWLIKFRRSITCLFLVDIIGRGVHVFRNALMEDTIRTANINRSRSWEENCNRMVGKSLSFISILHRQE